MTDEKAFGKVAELNSEGIKFHQKYMPDKAIELYKKALSINPDDVSVLCNMGSALQATGDIEQAIKCFEKAIGLKPEHAEAHYNYGSCLLLNGELKKGFKEYEWRLENSETAVKEKLWKGQNFEGKNLLISAEQGLGDTIQFIRLIKEAKKLGGTTILLIQAKMGRLLCGVEGIDMIIPIGAPLPEFDYFAPMLSLPAMLGIDEYSIDSAPYLTAEPELVEEWAKRFDKNRINIGIAWQGNLKIDKERSFTLENFREIAAIENVNLVSLQAGNDRNQIAEQDFSVMDLGDSFDAGQDAFIDCAAVMENLDMIITLDTSIAHLAGALGCKTWTALKAIPDWRWQMEKNTTVWYENMTLFRQKKAGQWQDVFAKMATELNKQIQNGEIK